MAVMSFPAIGLNSARDIVDLLLPLVSWKTLALVLALANIKNIPFAWHVRLFYYLFGNIRSRPGVTLPGNADRALDFKGRPTHPVFVPTSIFSRTPLLETDYNMHKSNSTYFSDLDISRTALVTRLYTPGWSIVNEELDKELLEAASKDGKVHKKKAPLYIALGSVYCTFKREIKPYELYEVQTKIAAWDRKWLYIMSFFLRPEKRKGEGKTLFAVGISKYVVKKGRLTVPPERVLRASGFLPPRPEGTVEPSVVADSGETSATGTPASGEGIIAAKEVDSSLLREVLTLEDKIAGSAELDKQRKENGESWDSEEWTWERIEQERLRGLQVIEGYAELDAKLLAEWEA